MRDLLFILWFFLPAGFANAAPIFAAKLPYLRAWSFPLDCYATFRRKRILGSHKTLRGLLSGIAIGILIAYLQVFIYIHVPLIRTFVLIDYASLNPLLFGLLLATGALIGDALKSFVKRQLGIAPGKSWFPFDQLDYVIGGVLCISFYVQLAFYQYLILSIIWFLLHPLSTFIGYEVKLKESPI